MGSVKRAIFGIWGLDGVESATPGVLASLVGVCQWFALLNRPFFSIFDKVFAFARREPQDVATLLPVGTKAELSLFTALVPLLVAELARDYAPIIAASDAAPEFGFGVSVASADDRTLRDLGRLAERRGDYVRLDRAGDPDAEPEKPRLGTAHRLALRRCDFEAVLSLRAKRIEHSGVLEVNGALILLKWLSRSTRFHGSAC